MRTLLDCLGLVCLALSINRIVVFFFGHVGGAIQLQRCSKSRISGVVACAMQTVEVE